jgi:hypothetical protein
VDSVRRANNPPDSPDNRKERLLAQELTASAPSIHASAHLLRAASQRIAPASLPDAAPLLPNCRLALLVLVAFDLLGLPVARWLLAVRAQQPVLVAESLPQELVVVQQRLVLALPLV